MGKAAGFSALTSFLVVLVVVPTVVAVEHIVGGSFGWATGVNYGSWAAGETFNVGDTLLFSYDSSHTVEVVDKDGYDNCDPTKATDSFQDGNTTVALTGAGPIFFICATTGHCTLGMKLAVTVTGGRAPPPTTTPATSPPPKRSTPAAPPPTPPSTAATPPTPQSPSPDGSPNRNGPPLSSRPPTGPNGVGGVAGKWSCVMVVLGVTFAFFG